MSLSRSCLCFASCILAFLSRSLFFSPSRHHDTPFHNTPCSELVLDSRMSRASGLPDYHHHYTPLSHRLFGMKQPPKKVLVFQSSMASTTLSIERAVLVLFFCFLSEHFQLQGRLAERNRHHTDGWMGLGLYTLLRLTHTCFFHLLDEGGWLFGYNSQLLLLYLLCLRRGLLQYKSA